jgi:hypothetical protein
MARLPKPCGTRAASGHSPPKPHTAYGSGIEQRGRLGGFPSRFVTAFREVLGSGPAAAIRSFEAEDAERVARLLYVLSPAAVQTAESLVQRQSSEPARPWRRSWVAVEGDDMVGFATATSSGSATRRGRRASGLGYGRTGGGEASAPRSGTRPSSIWVARGGTRSRSTTIGLG